MLQLNNIHISQGQFEIKNYNLHLQKGEYVVLMGKTGCGKTTILEAVCGLRKITAGTIILAGEEITHLKPADRNIGYVPQEGVLFETMSALDEEMRPLMYALIEEIRAQLNITALHVSHSLAEAQTLGDRIVRF